MLSWLASHGVSGNTVCMNDDEILKTIDEMGDEYCFFRQLLVEYQQFSCNVSEKITHLKTAEQDKIPDILDQIKIDLDQCKQSLKEMKQEIKGFDGNALHFLHNIIDQYNKKYLSLKDLYGKVQKTVQRDIHSVTNGNVVGANQYEKVNTIHHDDNKCNECDRWIEKLTMIKKEKNEFKTLVDQLLNELNDQNDLVQEYQTNIDELANNHEQKISKLQTDKTQLMDMFNKAKSNQASLTQKVTLIQEENDKLITKELELLQRQLRDQKEMEQLTKEKNNHIEENNKLTILNEQYEQYEIENNKLIDNNNKLQTEKNGLLQQLKMSEMKTKIYEEKIRMHNDIISDNRVNTDKQKRKIDELQQKYDNERDERTLETNEYQTNHYELEIENIEQKYQHEIEIMQIKNDINGQDENEEDEELKEIDNPFEKYVSYFALNYPIEASVFSYYALIVFITAIGFHGDDVCTIGDQIISWIGFILFIIIPAICEIYKWYLTKSENNNTCIRILDICMKILILGILMLTADLRPFKCYIDNEVALQIGIIVFGTFCFIVHILITQINKKYKPLSQKDEDDEDDEDEKNDIEATDHESE